MFLTSYSDQLGELRSAVSRHDAAAVRRVAHTLKGAVSVFGAEAAQDAALNLETMGRYGDLSHSESAFERLAHALERLRPALIGLIEAGTNAAP